MILGDTNVTELGGVFDTNMPQGYSRSAARCCCRRTPTRTSAVPRRGSTAAVSAGFAALAVGMETGTDARS